jgi:hypothetical protein
MQSLDLFLSSSFQLQMHGITICLFSILPALTAVTTGTEYMEHLCRSEKELKLRAENNCICNIALMFYLPGITDLSE